MNTTPSNNPSFFQRTWKTFIILGFVLCISGVSFSQNTKGDRPVNNKGKVRENRFKTRSKKGDKARTKDIAGRRIRTKNKSSAQRAVINYERPKATKAPRHGGDRVGKPIRPVYGSQPRNNQNPGKGRVNVRSATGRIRNIFPQFGRFVHNPSQRPRTVQRPISNRPQLARLKRIQTNPDKPKKKRKVVPRSASRAFISRKSINPTAGFWNQRRKPGDRPYTKDISGRKLRTKNFETPRPGVIAPMFKPYYGRKRVGDRPYKGPAAGRHVSASKARQQAWKGDIAGRKIRGRNYRSKIETGGGISIFGRRAPGPRFGDKPNRVRGRGYQSVSQSGEKRTGKAPLPVRPPGIGADQIGNYRGNIRLFQSKPGMGRQGLNYTGNIKARKPLKGGGSRSGKRWNNQGQPIPVRTPSGDAARAAGYPGNIKRFQLSPGFSDQGEEFTGHVKARRPKKGGGSVSGKLWNNKRTPIAVRTPSRNAARAAGYPGNIKRFQLSPGFSDQGEEFTGYIKARRPKKGGGSVSGKLWNNKETPIPVRTPPASAAKAGKYPGKMKLFEQSPGFNDQGEEFTGFIKLKKFRRNYLKNPNQADEALKKARPDKTTYKVGDLQVRVKRRDYVKNPNQADEALKKLSPSKSTYSVDDLQVRVKQYNYTRNPNSAEGALKVREPGKAFARATDYQGNIKMKKFDLFGRRDLHPDAKFVKTNKNNVAGERDLVTNFKLWWARLFKKNDTQPDHLKEKEKKPRYDKGEQGLWYD